MKTIRVDLKCGRVKVMDTRGLFVSMRLITQLKF